MFFSQILNLFSSYLHNDVEENIEKLRKELSERQEINNQLKKENYKKQYEDISSFIERNSKHIDAQVEEVTALSSKIKELIKENDELLGLETKCDQLVESPEVKHVIKQLELLDLARVDINFFLNERTHIIKS